MSASSAANAAARPVVALVGDSHMQALGPRIRAVLAGQGVDARVIANPGKSLGWYIGSGALARAVQGATHVVFVIGGNDDWRNASLEEVRAAVQNAVGVLEPRPVLWVGPSTARVPDVAARHEDTAAKYARVIPEHVLWFDSRPVTRAGHRDDGVHFDSATYDAWAGAVAQRTRTLLYGPSWLELLLASLGIAVRS